jgi:hypothetical protein
MKNPNKIKQDNKDAGALQMELKTWYIFMAILIPLLTFLSVFFNIPFLTIMIFMVLSKRTIDMEKHIMCLVNKREVKKTITDTCMEW